MPANTDSGENAASTAQVSDGHSSLGKYTCPPEQNAGKAHFKGESAGGLQKGFFNIVSSFIGDVNSSVDDESQIKVTGLEAVKSTEGGRSGTGRYAVVSGGGTPMGFVSNGVLKNLKDSGMLRYLWSDGTPHYKYFGYGLALAVSGVPTGDGIPTADDYGLEVMVLAEYGPYIRPAARNVEWSADASDISYSGDVSQASVQSGDAASGSSSTASSSSGGSVASSMFFLSNAFRSIGDVSSAYTLTGNRALANDVPVSTTVFNLCKASMRSYIAGPYGNFIAYYPDYWGVYGNREPAVVIDDIELLDINVTMSDSEFYSHVYIPGVTIDGGSLGSGASSLMLTTGVVSIESDIDADYETLNDEGAFSDEPSPIIKKLINLGDDDEYAWMYSPRELYRRYGARPSVSQQSITAGAQAIQDATASSADETGSMTQNQAMVYLLALYEFMYHWANQCQVSISTTFMPIVFPGERVKVPLKDGRHVTVYVKGVSHQMSYDSGFTTKITACCPTGDLYPGMVRDFGDNGGGE